MLTGIHDLLHSDALSLQSIGSDHGLPIEVKTYQNMLHVWPSMPIPEAKRALDEVGQFLSDQKLAAQPVN